MSDRRSAVLAELRLRGINFADAIAQPADARADLPAFTSRTTETDGDVDLAAKVAQLQQGLTSRTVIGQAEGILMERHKITADDAFRMLVKASSVTNRKLQDVAADLVDTRELRSGR
jgi:AmiR/NasT family two-component response regulator